MSLSQEITVTVGPTLPTWRPPSGIVADIATNTMTSQTPYIIGDAIFQDYSRVYELLVWGSGVYAPGVGTFGAYVCGSGGHNTYFGNERYVFSLDDRQWRRYGPYGPGDPATDIYAGLTGNSSYDETHNAAGGTTPPFIWTQPPGELADGQPCPPHEYDGTVFLPPSFGGVGTAGSYCWVSQPFANQFQSGTIARKWDIAAGVAGSQRIASTNRWTRATQAQSVAGIRTTCVDTVAKRVYSIRAEDAPQPIDFFEVLDFSAGTGEATMSQIALPAHFNLAREPTGLFWTGPAGANRYMLVFGGVEGGFFSNLEVRIYNLASPGIYTVATLSGTVPQVSFGPGVCHCPDLNVSGGGVFYLYPGVDVTHGKIYKITPPSNPLSGNWVFQEQAFLQANGQPIEADYDPNPNRGPNDPPGLFHGLWKRLQYSSSARVVMFPTRPVAPDDPQVSTHFYAWTPPGL